MIERWSLYFIEPLSKYSVKNHTYDTENKTPNVAPIIIPGVLGVAFTLVTNPVLELNKTIHCITNQNC